VTDSGGASSSQAMSPNEPSVWRTTVARPLETIWPETKPLPESVYTPFSTLLMPMKWVPTVAWSGLW